MNKEDELLKLAKLRQNTRYDGFNNISDYEGGFYECDYVSPYSKSANNVDADVFLVLQDWSSDENMHGKCDLTKKYGYTPNVSTNMKLKSLLKEHLFLELKDTYTTNLFPFIKMGGMSASIPFKYMLKAATEFTVPMIKIVKPKIVVALGRDTYSALFESCQIDGHDSNNYFEFNGVRVYHQPHPAARISNKEKEMRWHEMQQYLTSLKSEK